MSIKFSVLGEPGRDNAAYAVIDSGTKVCRLLFDCGENILKGIRHKDIASIDHLLFSHFHLDHAAGFDSFFRKTYDRAEKPVYVWGPEGTNKIIHNRLRGFVWNLVEEAPGKWLVNDIKEKEIARSYYLTKEGFARKHKLAGKNFNRIILDNPDFKIEAALLNHIIPSAGYRISEKPSLNIDKQALENFGIKAGPWLEKVKDMSFPSSSNIVVENRKFSLGKLRKNLIVSTPGQSVAYLTDFIFDKTSRNRVKALINGCDTVICECQYSSEDAAMARRNYHLTAPQAARLAKEGRAKRLIIFHISERYKHETDYPRILNQAREIFPQTFFPSEWNI